LLEFSQDESGHGASPKQSSNPEENLYGDLPSFPPSYDEVMAAMVRKEPPISTSQPRGSLKKIGEENPYGKLSDVSREGPVGTIYGQWPGAEQAQQSQYRKLPLRLTAKTEQSHYAHLPSWLGGKKVAPTSDKQKKQEQEKGPAPRAP